MHFVRALRAFARIFENYHDRFCVARFILFGLGFISISVSGCSQLHFVLDYQHLRKLYQGTILMKFAYCLLFVLLLSMSDSRSAHAQNGRLDSLQTVAESSGFTETSTSAQVEQFLSEASKAACLLYTSPSPRDQRGSRMPSSA